MKVSSAREHLAVGFEPLASVNVSLEHAFIVEHVAHGLGDDDVDSAGQLNLFNLASDYFNFTL